MKKIFIFITIILIVLFMIAVMYISDANRQLELVKKSNAQYEAYLDKKVLGTDVTTVINKATNQNEKNEIGKDEKGFYIENNENSIKVELVMLNEEEKVTYQMETLQKAGINGFVKNFNLISFKCSKIEYHEKTKLVKKIVFEQMEQ